jgi:hypothetical protein
VHLEGPYITNSVLPENAVRASLDVDPSEEFSPRASTSCFHKVSSHGLGFEPIEHRNPKKKMPRSKDRMFEHEKTHSNDMNKLALQSFKEPEDRLFSLESATLLEVFSPHKI